MLHVVVEGRGSEAGSKGTSAFAENAPRAQPSSPSKLGRSVVVQQAKSSELCRVEP